MTVIGSMVPSTSDRVAISTNDHTGLVVDPLVARALSLVAAHLRERHPTVAPEIVEHHVNATALRLTEEARIHDYLPILIERNASASLERYSA